jgi:carboxyl-terminal processing protease
MLSVHLGIALRNSLLSVQLRLSEMKNIVCAALVVAALSACGGGGGSNKSTAVTTGETVSTLPVASSTVAQQCASPRSSSIINPDTGKPYGDVQGSLTTEMSWIRAYVNETYLWYNDVAYVAPTSYVIAGTVAYVDPSDNSSGQIKLSSNYDVVDSYFNSQRSTQFTSSGKPKDQYHFTYLTSDWNALSSSGSSVGYGFQAALIASSPPRSIVVAYTDPGTTAAANNIARGAKILQVNGVNVEDGDAAVLNEGLFSPTAGTQYTFQILDQGSTTPRTVKMTAAALSSAPVQNVQTLPSPYSDVGYLQFNDHIAMAESQLIAAVNQLKAANSGAGIKDLVLDLRYNGGGYLAIASELAYMISGAATTAGKTFEKITFNDKNPFGYSASDMITPFYSTALGFSTTEGVALPQLGLNKVYVLAGSATCSASEAIINGLRGVGVEVILIGGTTCGKPYGFIPADNCGVTYFTIQFKGVNAAEFGDYADGFIPGGTGSAANNVPGCVVADDFTQPLGNILEARLATALQYRTNGSCTATKSLAQSRTGTSALIDAKLVRSPLRENRFYRPR